jgi:AraC family transcriptional regulator
VSLSPPGLQEGSVDIAEDMSGVLRIYLALSHFSSGNCEINVDTSVIGSVSYESAFEDPILAGT